MTQYLISFPSGADLSMGGLREGQGDAPALLAVEV
jgi:hypothetical protein